MIQLNKNDGKVLTCIWKCWPLFDLPYDEEVDSDIKLLRLGLICPRSSEYFTDKVEKRIFPYKETMKGLWLLFRRFEITQTEILLRKNNEN